MSLKSVILFIFVGIHTWAVASAESISWPQYLQKYRASDENLKSSQKKLKVAESEYRSQISLWQTTLSVNPYYAQVDKTLQSISEDKEAHLSYELKQTLPVGGFFLIEAQNKLWDEDSDSTLIDRKWTFSYEQALWGNSFGRLDDLKSKEKKSLLSQEKNNFIGALLNSCFQASEQYLGTYKSYKYFHILKDSLKSSQEAYRVIQKSYNKRLVKRINFLSAKDDHKQTQSNYIEAESKYKKDLQSLNSFSKDLNISELKNPEIYFINKPTRIFNKAQMWDLRAQQAAMSSAKTNIDIVNESNKNNVSLGFEVSHSVYTSSGTSYNDDGFGLNVKMDWDLYKPKKSELKIQALHQAQIESLNLQRLEEKLELNFNHYQSDLFTLKKQIQFNQEKLILKQQQLKEARRLMRAGKMEFIDYIRYRDQYLTEQKNEVDLKVKYWLLILKGEKYGATNLCGKGEV